MSPSERGHGRRRLGSLLATVVVATVAVGGAALFPGTPSGGGGDCSLPAYPDASCTGVPAGTTLTAYTGPFTITTPNTVIDSKEITDCLVINTTGVIIRNSYIHASCDWLIGVTGGSGTSVTVEDTEIDCEDYSVGGNGIVGDDVTATRVNIHRCENGVSVDGNFDLEDSYIHDFFMNNPTTHSDGVQTFDGVSDVQIIHNTFLADDEDNIGAQTATSAIIAQEPGHLNWLIQYNKFAGAGFTVYCAVDAQATFVIRDNAFSDLPIPPAYGYSRYCADDTQSGNFQLETSAPLSLD